MQALEENCRSATVVPDKSSVLIVVIYFRRANSTLLCCTLGGAAAVPFLSLRYTAPQPVLQIRDPVPF
jgi:hypothetical protein